ncbi:hypothetical protein SAMN05216196_10157 [Lutimaribacter pacificus]|uniref:Uncharacterized protein n=1 Tax=Lutimaribacter pacificus TaxID=391948 RepID=A0A1H0A706_9RHOB|nr:hypothetical protein [Lutimaribacter pacificus]SDN29408.1 hypothetical protein SAMN05216196_10157 [Lutimaribacter pacificus]SHJ72487.1 hypothetical protein SAMN05444142_1011160 [Lutimaribacter pacificus]
MIRHILRMTMWARRPPSRARVRLVLGVLLLCAVLVAVERLFGWPGALTLEPLGRGPLR